MFADANNGRQMFAMVGYKPEQFGRNVRETQYVFGKRISKKKLRGYNALMFNTISSNVFRQLRERTGLSQTDFGKIIGARRQTVSKFESGKAQPDKAQETRILEVTQCSKEELAELICEQLSELIDRPVGVGEDVGGYEPTTALARANALLRKPVDRLPAPMVRALNKRIRATRLLSIVFESNTEDLVELTLDCHETLTRKKDEDS